MLGRSLHKLCLCAVLTASLYVSDKAILDERVFWINMATPTQTGKLDYPFVFILYWFISDEVRSYSLAVRFSEPWPPRRHMSIPWYYFLPHQSFHFQLSEIILFFCQSSHSHPLHLSSDAWFSCDCLTCRNIEICFTRRTESKSWNQLHDVR